jgi:hypothetical protein
MNYNPECRPLSRPLQPGYCELNYRQLQPSNFEEARFFISSYGSGCFRRGHFLSKFGDVPLTAKPQTTITASTTGIIHAKLLFFFYSYSHPK